MKTACGRYDAVPLTDAPSISADIFRDIFSTVAATAAVVSVTDSSGRPHGLACTAMVPVSAEPPLLLVCVAKTSDTLAFIEEASSFVVNIMASGAGQAVSRLATKSPDKFRGIAWQPSPVTANPIIRAHRSAFLDCVVTERITAGDHYIFIGRIVAGEQQADVEPLLYFRRQFHRLGPASAEPTASAVRSAGPTSDARGA